jgi:hypothetical protein
MLDRPQRRPVAWRERLYLAPCASLAAAAVVVFLLAGCGGGDEESVSDGGTATPARGPDLPKPSNRSLRALIQNFPQGPVLAPSVSVVKTGENRFAFGLFDSGNRQIADVRIGVYVARGLDDTARGPYLARYQPIDIEDRYRSKTTADDPDAAHSIYVARVPMRGAGGHVVAGVAQLGGDLVATSPTQVMVSRHSDVPDVGDRAIRVHTPTRKSVGGDIQKIETRVPPDSMHDVDLADALDARRPVLVIFATPGLCETRVCGPVVDVAEQVKSEYGDRMDFIHMEVYNDNDPNKGIRPELKAYGLQTEPWLFVMDESGNVTTRIEGAFSVGDLEAAVERARGG